MFPPISRADGAGLGGLSGQRQTKTWHSNLDRELSAYRAPTIWRGGAHSGPRDILIQD